MAMFWALYQGPFCHCKSSTISIKECHVEGPQPSIAPASNEEVEIIASPPAISQVVSLCAQLGLPRHQW